jgi:hypothetical protein
MSFEPPTNHDRKRKSTEAPEPVVRNTVDESCQRDTRPRRVSTEGASSVTLTYASMATGTLEQNHAMPPIESLESIRKLIQDLSSPDGDVVASLYTLDRYVFESDTGSQILQEIIEVGGCRALVQLAKTFLEKARMGIPNCDRVTELTGFTMILRNTFIIMIALTYAHPVCKDFISSIGGVEVLVEVLTTFPKCEDLQSASCKVLCNLSTTSVGAEKASEAGAIKVLVGAVKNYPANEYLFVYCCDALADMCESNFERTKTLIDLGGITTWPDNPEARVAAQRLLQVMAAGINVLINTLADTTA